MNYEVPEFLSPSNPKFSELVITDLSHPTDRGFKNPATGKVDIWVDADANKLTIYIKNNKGLADSIANAYKERFDAEIMPDNDTYQFQLNELYKALNGRNMDEKSRQKVLDALDPNLQESSLTNKPELQELINKQSAGSGTSVESFLNLVQPQLADDHPLKSYKLPHYTSPNKDQDRIVMTLKSMDGSLRWHDHSLSHEDVIETSKKAKQLDVIIKRIQEEFFPNHTEVHARTKAYIR
jgi:hypothetical protein